jgi:integrase
MKLEAARTKAIKWLGEVADGGDPAGEIYKERTVQTMSDLACKFLDEYAALHKKPRSIREDRQILDNRILPFLGTKKVTAVTPQDIKALQHKLKDTPIQANRCLVLLSKMFVEAASWGIVAQSYNPVRGIRKFKEVVRKRFLSPDELARLGAALGEGEPAVGPVATNGIRLLLLTGARRGEVQSCRWEWVRISAGLWPMLALSSRSGTPS